MTLLINCWNLICFSVVIISAQYWSAIPDTKWLIVFVTFLIGSARHHLLCWFTGALFATVVVIVCANLYQVRIETVFQDGQNITIKGKVDSLFKEISHGQIVTFSVDTINDKRIDYFFRPNIKLSIPFDYKFLLGERWQLDVRVKPVYGKLNEAGFDQEKYYVSQNLHAKAALTGAPHKISESHSLRFLLYSRISNLIENLKAKPLLLALTFGDRNYISPQTWGELKTSGLIHLVAISGLHIGMAFSIGWLVGRPFSMLSLSMLNFSLISGLLLATFYAWLAGFSLPTKRALMMCFFICGMTQFRLNFSRWRILLTTFCLILLFDPFAALSAGFWMSFGAVAAIYLLLSSAVFKRIGKLRQLLLMQLVLVGVMTPITGFFFGGVSLVSPLYNLVFVPWFSFVVVPLVFVALFISFFSPVLSLWVWECADLSLSIVQYAIRYADVGWIELSLAVVMMFAGSVILWISSPFLNRHQLALFFCTGFLWYQFEQKDESWYVDIMDVGHGLAVLIGQDSEYILYDTGYSWEGGGIAESIIAPVLARRSVSQLDGLILSHTDSDHAGGKRFIENRFNPKKRWSSEGLPGYLPCIQGESWNWNGLEFTALWPPKRVVRAHNPHSCVVKVSDGHISILLTGDIDAISEYLIARQGVVLDSDIMLVPHHGSDTSSTSTFIDQVNPSVAIASLGKGNQWGIPAESVLHQYESRGIKWVDTGEYGQITISVNQNGWKITSARGKHSSPWYRQILRKGVE